MSRGRFPLNSLPAVRPQSSPAACSRGCLARFQIYARHEWPRRTARHGFCPPGARLAAFWFFFARACPPERGPKSVKVLCFQKWPWTTWDAGRCVSSLFWDLFGPLYSLCVPNGFKGGPFWDQKRLKNGPEMRFSGCVLGLTEVLKRMFQPTVWPLWTVWTPCMAQTLLEGRAQDV